MKISCSLCGTEAEIDVDLVEGQHVICPSCGQKFSYHADQEFAGQRQTGAGGKGCDGGVRSGYLVGLLKWGGQIWDNMSRLDRCALIAAVALTGLLCLASLFRSILPGGSYWSVARERTPKTDEKVWQIKVAKEASAFSVPNNDVGCLIDVYVVRRRVCVYVPVTGDGSFHFVASFEKLYTEKGWDELKEGIHKHVVDYETAKEIIDYIDTLR